MSSFVYMPQNFSYVDPLHTQQNVHGAFQPQVNYPQFQAQQPQPPVHQILAAQAAALQHQQNLGGLQPIHQLLFNSQAREPTAGIKRGSDEMLHAASAQMINNNNLKSVDLPTHDLEPHDAKKVRLEVTEDSVPNSATRVILVKDIPADSTEAELCQLAAPFGKVTNVLLLKAQRQAFIEMGDPQLALACVNYHQSVAANIRGKQVQLQFSNIKELRSEQNGATQAALAAVNSAQMSGLETGEPRTVLHVSVENMAFPVSIEVLKQIFSRFGQVLKIIIFNKNSQFQALVQFSDPISTQTAKVSLDGQNIYNNCCTLRIDFSKLTNLNVKFNNEKTRDFTNLSLPVGDGTVSPGIPESPGPITSHCQSLVPASIAVTAPPPAVLPAHHHVPQQNLPLATAASQMALSQQMAQHLNSTSMAHPGFGAQTLNYMHHNNGVPHPFHQLQYPASVQLPQHIQQLQNLQGFHQLSGLNHSAGLPGLGGLNTNMMMSPGQMAANLALRLPNVPQSGAVVLVSNLNEEKVTPDDLFTLFGVYGDVIRVKVLYNKKDNALLQYSEPQQAQLALTHLDKIKVWGKQIRVAPSKHPIVQMPTDLQADGAKLTKDFTNSPLHRYKKKGSKNYQNIYPPSATLHLSNIPQDVSGDLLKTEFAKYGKVSAFKFFEKDHKMALIQMESIDDAVMGLVEMHNFEFGVNKMHLKVAFSKFYI